MAVKTIISVSRRVNSFTKSESTLPLPIIPAKMRLLNRLTNKEERAWSFGLSFIKAVVKAYYSYHCVQCSFPGGYTGGGQKKVAPPPPSKMVYLDHNGYK